MAYLNQKQVIVILKKRQGERSLRALAEELECSPAYLSDIFLGRRRVGPKILRPLGLRQITERSVRYERTQ